MKKYIRPSIEILYYEIEDSITAGSAKATFIGSSTSDSPLVDAWNSTPNDAYDTPFQNNYENW